MFEKLTRGLRARLPRNTQLVMWMVVLPLAMTLFAWWEHTRFTEAQARNPLLENQVEIQRLQGMLERIQGDRYATLEVNGRKYGNPLASQKLKEAIAELRGDNVPPAGLLASAVGPAIRVAMAAGIAAMLLGGLGLSMVHLAGRRALRSRDELMRAFTWWRVNLPLYLGLLLLTQLVAIGALTVVRGHAAYVAQAFEHASQGEMKGHLYLLLLALALMWSAVLTLWRLKSSLRGVLDREPCEVLGRAVTAREAPGLWRYVADVAQRLGASVPDHIVVGVAQSFYVTAQDVVLRPGGQRLRGETMYLPLTYLAVLRKDEVDAIVAHELGHFAGEDTRYSLRFSPLYRGMGDSLAAMQGGDGGTKWASTPAITFTSYLMQRFDHAVMHWSRLREFAADQASVRVAGAHAAARALIRMTALNAAVRDVIDGVARRPDEAGHDLIELLSQALRLHGLHRPDFSPEVATTHPSDTHPPTVERLRALNQPLSAPLMDAALGEVDGMALAWVRSLFADSQALQAALLNDFKATAREHNQAVRQHLSAMADQASAVVEIRDGRTLFWLGTGLAATFALIAGACGLMALVPRQPGVGSGGHTMLLVCLAATAAFGAMALWGWKRSSVMAMALTPSGVRAPGLRQELSWGHVADYAITAGYTLVVQFELEPEAPEPVLLHRNYFRLAYASKKRQLSISMSGVRGMKNQAFFELLHKYLRAWHARERLRGM